MYTDAKYVKQLFPVFKVNKSNFYTLNRIVFGENFRVKYRVPSFIYFGKILQSSSFKFEYIRHIFKIVCTELSSEKKQNGKVLLGDHTVIYASTSLVQSFWKVLRKHIENFIENIFHLFYSSITA